MVSDREVTFRLAASREELERLLRLRQEVYLGCRTRVFCSVDTGGCDLDEYDPYAHHLGLFEGSEGAAMGIGYMRLITDTLGPQIRILRQIAHDHPNNWEPFAKPPPTPLPCFQYFPGIDPMIQRYRAMKAYGLHMVEPSRFAIKPGLRNRRLGRLAILATAAYAAGRFSDAYDSLICCARSHAGIYESLGFRKVGDGDVFGIHACCLLGNHRDFGYPARRLVQEMVNEHRRTGRMTLPALTTMRSSETIRGIHLHHSRSESTEPRNDEVTNVAQPTRTGRSTNEGCLRCGAVPN
jgi:hypothetical protein